MLQYRDAPQLTGQKRTFFSHIRVFPFVLYLNPKTQAKHPTASRYRFPFSQVLAYGTGSSPVGWDSSRYLFAETDRNESLQPRRFVSLDYRGGGGGNNGGTGEASVGVPGWMLGTGSDGNGALGLGHAAELSR